MNEEEFPNVEEIKERLKIEVPVEDEAAKVESAARNVVEELKGLGKQFAETVQTAWHSEERQKVEGEIRQGVNLFVEEVEKAIRQLRESEVAAKLKEEATEVKTKVETSDLGRKAREGLVQGLRWLSEELGKLAEQFAPAEGAESSTAVDETDQPTA